MAWILERRNQSDMPPRFAASVPRALGLVTEFVDKVTWRRSMVTG